MSRHLGDRRGVAMIAAMWLVVAIAVVALSFSLDAKERRTLGLNAAERGQGHAAALGALATVQAAMDVVLRSGSQNVQSLAGTRSGDPWMFPDSLFGGPVYVDSVRVDVYPRDLGTQLNINIADVNQLKAFFGFVLGDYAKADQLSAMITDWRDIDNTPQMNGDEVDGYIKKGLLALPANGPFGKVEDLLMVEGMTPEIYALVSNDLTVYGTGQINVNTAPVEVLRSIPGITDAIISTILNQRSRGLRIASIAQLVPGAGGGGRGGRGGALTGAQSMANIQAAQLAQAANVTTSEVLLTMIVKSARQAQPARVTALMQRAGTTATITWVQW
jgi:type II secretory pathway component PulK